MCGISGFLSAPSAMAPDQARRIAELMANRLVHRGPDAGATWQDHSAGIALGHRRLLIIDLSPTGAQPMVSAGGRWVIAFNGEVYNFLDLRSELERFGTKF